MVCVVCVWDRETSSKGQPPGSPCPSLSPPDPCTQRRQGPQEAQGSSYSHFIDEETEAPCFQPLANLAEPFLFMYCHQGQ